LSPRLALTSAIEGAFFPPSFLVPHRISKCWFSFAIVAVSDVGVSSNLLDCGEHGLAMKAAVSSDFYSSQDVFVPVERMNRRARAVEQWRQEVTFITGPARLGVHDDLSTIVDHSEPVVALLL